MPTQRQSIANRCQSSANPVPICCQSVVANLMSIRGQQDVNPLQIRCRSIANLMSADSANFSPIRWQSIVNPSPITQFNSNHRPTDQSAHPPVLDQSDANPTIQCKSDNPPPIHHSSEIQHESDANPIHQYNANSGPICQSRTNMSIHRQSPNPTPHGPCLPIAHCTHISAGSAPIGSALTRIDPGRAN